FQQRLILGLPGHAYHPHPAVFYLQTLAYRVLAPPVLGDHGFVYYRYGRSLCVIGVAKATAGDERDAHGGKVCGAYLDILHRRLLIGPRLITIHGDRARGIGAIAEGRNTGVSGRLDAGESLDTGDHLVLKAPGAFGIVSGAK